MKLFRFLGVIAVATQVGAAELVSVAVGRVQDRVVTSREVNINQMIEKTLYAGPKASTESLVRMDPRAKEFAREVNAVLLERVVQLEAKSFAASRIETVDVDQAEKTVRDRLQSNAEWKHLEVTRDELRESLSVKLQAKKFIRFKADSSSVPVTDSEARQYYEQNRLKFGDLPFENFKDNIKTFLSRQQVDRRLKDWFEVLQAKYKVRNFVGEL